MRAWLGRMLRKRLVRKWARRRGPVPPREGGWWITFTPTKDGEVIAWATEKPTPRDATVLTMFHFPGEVHFAFGETVEQARRRLEGELPRDAGG